MGILNEKVTERRENLIHALNRVEIYRASDGRYITNFPLAELEMMNIQIMNEAAKAYGERS